MMKCASFILLALASCPAFALTGNELLNLCAAAPGSGEHRECRGYVLGVTSGANMMMAGMRQNHSQSDAYPLLFCVSPSVSTARLVDIAVAYLKAHPSERRYDAASEVLLSLRAAFPCP
jgi:hypothetical protein